MNLMFVEKMVDLKQIDLLKAKDIADFSHIFFIVRPVSIPRNGGDY